ncbi:hypothetical protein [Sphingobacterium thalpophilum]|uniref:hypothetical protein n=1 Tax=Sphingobacterium thalpophilum TaxID=259 RepID=UPI003C72C4EF
MSNNKNQFLELNLIVPLFSRGDRMRARKVKRMKCRSSSSFWKKPDWISRIGV